ncbi:BTAD domain-containing putative transcriptional regulator [Anaerovorax sp. IOR16]|uniref:BTAD domain-containing putative transcriptional regulator n=1 Tax=Anaerovorax sp. IOR16 TaxID=2773458 RepID=UPI0019D078D2|nr:BTAD domain-containing putative transcriptional regulator [Anaerovorax sp. IOR16]
MLLNTDFKTQGNKEGVLYIQLLGDFLIEYNQNTLSGEKVHAKQVWNLLEYLIVNRKKETSLDTLIEILWNEKEVEDPANALKNLAYRLRNTIKKNLKLDSNNCIVYKYGSYAWNTEVPCVFDVDLFEDYIKEAEKPSIEKSLACDYYYKAFQIYKGNFLPQSEYKEWVRPIAVYYQRMYMKVCEKLCELLMEQESYDIIEEVCRRAITVDPFVEINHVNLIKALIATNNQKKAVAHYNEVSNMFYDELGVQPSEAITKLYKDIINKNLDFEKDIAVIKGDLAETNDVTGTLQCNYEMFKIIYRLQARAALRNGKSIFIALLTVTSKNGSKIPSNQLEETLDNLIHTLCSFLRKDDVVTRYGRTQFLLMLSNITYENTVKVLNRLVNRINKSEIGNKVEIYGQMESIDPLELGDYKK